MPCYNDGEYIEASIESVLKQTYKNLELIIINDGSTDRLTIETLNKLSDKRIKLYNVSQNGPAAARNFGIKKASGPYILPLDADDLIENSYIEKAVHILDKDSSIGIVYCLAELFDQASGTWELPAYSIENILVDNVIFITAMFRKIDWVQTGGFNESLVHGMEDYDFWLSIVEIGRSVVQIPEKLFFYRIKKSSRQKQFLSDVNKIERTYKTIYDNHSALYEKYNDIYINALRNTYLSLTSDIQKLRTELTETRTELIATQKALNKANTELLYLYHSSLWVTANKIKEFLTRTRLIYPIKMFLKIYSMFKSYLKKIRSTIQGKKKGLSSSL